MQIVISKEGILWPLTAGWTWLRQAEGNVENGRRDPVYREINQTAAISSLASPCQSCSSWALYRYKYTGNQMMSTSQPTHDLFTLVAARRMATRQYAQRPEQERTLQAGVTAHSPMIVLIAAGTASGTRNFTVRCCLVPSAASVQSLTLASWSPEFSRWYRSRTLLSS